MAPTQNLGLSKAIQEGLNSGGTQVAFKAAWLRNKKPSTWGNALRYWKLASATQESDAAAAAAVPTVVTPIAPIGAVARAPRTQRTGALQPASSERTGSLDDKQIRLTSQQVRVSLFFLRARLVLRFAYPIP